MMSALLSVLLFFFLISEAFAVGKGKMPWLGVVLGPTTAESTNAGILPQGVGLSVREISESSPLEAAGGKAGDLWWKLDDQILVNMGQLVVLLKMREPGDEVVLQFYRDRQLRQHKVILGERPAEIFTKRSAKMIVHRPEAEEEVEEVAEMTTGGYLYHLQDGAGGLHFKVSQNEKILFDGAPALLSSEKNTKREWRGALLILRQALAARETRNGAPKRLAPRRRYVPPPTRE